MTKIIPSDIILDTKNYIETYFYIRSKDREVIPFILNPIQNDYLKHRSYIGEVGKGQRDIILKGRQHGFTTLKAAEFLHDSMTNEGVSSVIVGHDDEAMKRLLENVRLMYYSVPSQDRPRTKYDNKDEIFFPSLNSRMYISTYRKLRLRSQTINNILMTEVAFWGSKDVGELVAGMTESVPMDGNICIESTPEGVGGYFWEQVNLAKKGESIYKLFLYPWFVNKDYKIERDKWEMLPKSVKPTGEVELDPFEKMLVDRWGLSIPQIVWRRYKMVSMGDMRINDKGIKQSRRFAQEYECSFTQSGMSVFDASYLIPSSSFRKPKENGKYVHGADTAEGVEGGNYNVLYTIDYETGEVVNKIRGLWKPREFAERIHKIALEYGGLVGVESNNTGHAVILKLAELWEEEAHKRAEKAENDFRDALKKNAPPEELERLKDKSMDRMVDLVPYRLYSETSRLGWNTNQLNRKTMFVEGEEALRDGSLKMAHEDQQGIEELIACQYNDKMKEEAPEGMTDDSIIALLIAWQMMKYYKFYFGEGATIEVTSH